MKKILSIVDRVMKRKAIGIIYNIPPDEEKKLEKKLIEENHIVIKGSYAYRGAMLQYRLGSELNAKHFRFCMLPGLLNNQIICIKNADTLKPSYARVLDEFHKYKIPLLLLMNSDTLMKDFRKLSSYYSVLTIEQDYETL